MLPAPFAIARLKAARAFSEREAEAYADVDDDEISPVRWRLAEGIEGSWKEMLDVEELEVEDAEFDDEGVTSSCVGGERDAVWARSDEKTYGEFDEDSKMW